MSLLKRAGLGLSALALALGISSSADARSRLRIGYQPHKSHIFKDKSEIALKVPIRKGVSYSLLVKIFTGTEANVSVVRAFNDNKPLIYIPNPNPEKDQGFIYIPRSLLTSALKKILDENKFTTFEIDNEDEEGIDNLWQVAKEFMEDRISMSDKIGILLALNDEINPINPIVYNGQKILVPASLVDETLIEEKPKPLPKISKPRAQEPIPSHQEAHFKQAIPGNNLGNQNPLREPLSKLKANLDKKEKFGAPRARTSRGGGYRITKHSGIDLAGPVGTPLYPIKRGVVLQAGKEPNKKFWRNGIVVTIKLDGSNITTKYIHLRRALVRVGQHVDLNTKVGEIGKTGNAKATKRPHVHIGVKNGSKLVDPTPYVIVGR